MKKGIFVLLSFIAMNAIQAQDKKVITTASMIQDMAQQIVGDLYEVDCLVPIGGDPHLYDPVPDDARRLSQADMIIKNGLTFEGWLDELIDNSGTKATQVTVTEGVESIASLSYANSVDPHAWMDAANAVIYARNIKDALINLDTENTATYQQNFETYALKLKELDQYIIDQISTIPMERRVLITTHDAFQYYGRKYGLKLEAVLGTSTDAEEQTSDIMRVNKVLRETGVPSVFIESTVNPKLLEQIAKDNDVVVGGSLFADSIGEKDSDASTYYDMMKYNTDVIVKALTRNREVGAETAVKTSENSSKIWWIVGAAVLIGIMLIVGKLGKS